MQCGSPAHGVWLWAYRVGGDDLGAAGNPGSSDAKPHSRLSEEGGPESWRSRAGPMRVYMQGEEPSCKTFEWPSKAKE